MKILNTDDLMEVADKILDQIGESPNGLRVTAAQQNVIDAVQELADSIAEHYGIQSSDATWEGKAMAGLCASFRPANPGQPCPEPIHDGDEGGDWEVVSK